MRRESNGAQLSAVFVDYDNIYLSLRRKSEEAAKRFSKDAAVWLRELETGRLITPTTAPLGDVRRRMVMNRCYGNPVPRRSGQDNSTDMNSFPFVRHHFLRAGFEVVDCPPLTAQLKNSSDIRMVMDVRDFLTHDTYFDEFIILSGDADFTPVLHRLRAHARRTIIFANDYTATPYTAICDGEVRESDLINLLVDGRLESGGVTQLAGNADFVAARAEIIAEVASQVRAAGQPVPLESLAERAVRVLGHERTAGSGWAGAGSFRELLADGLPDDVRLSDDPPYFAYPVGEVRPAAMARELRNDAAAILTRRDTAPRGGLESQSSAPETRALPQPPVTRSAAPSAPAPTAPSRSRAPLLETQPVAPLHEADFEDDEPSLPRQTQPALRASPAPQRSVYGAPSGGMPPAPASPPPQASRAVASPAPQAPARAQSQRTAPAPASAAAILQQSVTRIYEACQAPPLAPPDYRRLFEAMANEITDNGLQGSQTLANIQARALAGGLQLQRDDVRFVLDVVSEPDPWFEQGASANLFAGRFRNFVVGRCRSQGLSLSVEELDLIEAWFAGGPDAPGNGSRAPSESVAARGEPARKPQPQPQPLAQPQRAAAPNVDGWWNETAPVARTAGTPADDGSDDEFPRIVRSRLRG